MRSVRLFFFLPAIIIGAGAFPRDGVRATELSFPVLSFPVVDTGQSRCYGIRGGGQWSCPSPGESVFGQDAQYATHPPRYRDNGDGTVSDLVTGLMWEKGFTRDVPWREAPARATQATTGGHSDWRVPTIKQLYSLMNFDGATGLVADMSRTPADAKPYLDMDVFDFEYPTEAQTVSRGRPLRFIDAQYISSTAYRGLTMRGNATFFGVNFADGRIKGYGQEPRMRAGFYLRLVRGNPAYGTNDFHDAGNGVVTDRATGLAWMKTDSGHESLRNRLGRTHYRDGRMDWPEALAFCEGLDHLGHDDWRLPDAKELQSLVDYTRSPQGTRSAAIDPMFHATAITDEHGQPNFPGYWASTTHLDGRHPGTDAVVVYFGEALGAFSPRPGGPMGGGPPGSQMSGGPPGNQMGGGPPGNQMGGGPPGGQMGGRPPPPGGLGGPGMGGPSGGFGGGPRSVGSKESITDVHGAGAQRSDPKVGDPSSYPVWGHGPQGDVRRVYNHVRCVRTAG